MVVAGGVPARRRAGQASKQVGGQSTEQQWLGVGSFSFSHNSTASATDALFWAIWSLGHLTVEEVFRPFEGGDDGRGR